MALDDALMPKKSAAMHASGARLIRCARCRHVVTNAGEALRQNGRHRHTFMNPAGRVFEIRLFREAVGAVEVGSPSDDYSWFPPARWVFADCAKCRGQLGWAFIGERRFFGFVASTLEDDEKHI